MWEIWVRLLGWEEPPGEGKGNPLQYCCLENPMDRGAVWAAVRGIAESDTTEQLKFLKINVYVNPSHAQELTGQFDRKHASLFLYPSVAAFPKGSP